MKTLISVLQRFQDQDSNQGGGTNTTSTSEVGHVKNVANFNKLIQYSLGYSGKKD